MGTARITTVLSVLLVCGLGCSKEEGTSNNPIQNAGAGGGGAGGAGGEAGTAGMAGAAGVGGDGMGGAGGTQPIDRSMLTDVGVGAPLDYANAAMWACRPDLEPNQCHQDMTASRMEADGTRVPETHTRAENPAFDCFYVYPTVLLSGAPQMVDFSQAGIDIVNDPLQTQGARFSRICRMFAPLYRQVGLSGGAPVMGSDRALGLQDVRDAFAYYLANWNEGRKFVLLGHSQGTMMLTGMMQMDLDSEAGAEARARMISALLIGGSVQTAADQPVGGTFQNIPICTMQGQAGCVIAYASYASDGPPGMNGIFARNSGEMKAACVDPKVISGNTGRFKGSYFRKRIANPTFAPTTPLPDDLETPFAVYRDLFKGACVEKDGAHYLEFTIEPSSDTDMRQPPWRNTTVEGIGFGLHLVDYHIPLEDLIDAVTLQAQTAG